MSRDHVPAVIVSVVVLLMFGGALAVMLLRTLPPNSETLVNALIGSLATMTTGVVYYWTGSTAGSQNKDKTIARNAELLATMTPPPGEDK